MKIKIHKTIMLPVVLHGFETWSVILREEHRLNVLEIGVLGRYLGLKGSNMLQTGVLGRYLGLTESNVLDTGVLGRYFCLTGSNMLETGEVLVSKRE